MWLCCCQQTPVQQSPGCAWAAGMEQGAGTCCFPGQQHLSLLVWLAHSCWCHTALAGALEPVTPGRQDVEIYFALFLSKCSKLCIQLCPLCKGKLLLFCIKSHLHYTAMPHIYNYLFLIPHFQIQSTAFHNQISRASSVCKTELS